MRKNNIITDHTLIINELERSIEFYNWSFILSFLPKGSFLVGGYIRDIILKRITSKVDIDIVVPFNVVEIGQKIANKFNAKFIVLDQERDVVRIILNQISIDIAKQSSSSIIDDLCSRDFSINAIAFSFDRKCLIDPLSGIDDIKNSLLRTSSEINLLADPLRILRCFRFVSELDFKIDKDLLTFIKIYKEKLYQTANERINYEILRIVNGDHALGAVLLIKKINIFGLEDYYKNSCLIDLGNFDCKEFNQSEKEKFLPLFFLVQIFDSVTIEKLKFSKYEILKTKLLRKWLCILKSNNISHLNEMQRFYLHKELEKILPSFIFYLPSNMRLEWLNRWRDSNDKLFHPKNLINGNVIKEHCNIKNGPLLGKLMLYLSAELAYGRLDNFDEAIYKAERWIKQNAPKCD